MTRSRGPAKALLTALLVIPVTGAALTACTQPHSTPAPKVSGQEPGAPLVPGISGPPAIKVDPWAGSTGSTVRPHLTLPPIPPAGSPVGLPLEGYLQTAIEQEQTLSAAAAQVAQRCMSAAGFSFPVVPPPDDQMLVTQFFDRQNAGLTSLAQARAYGFQLPPRGFEFLKRSDPPLPSFVAAKRQHGTGWAAALLGEVPGMRPGTPPLGCLRAANTLVFGGFNGNLELGVVPNILGTALTWTDSDPRVLAAQQAWSACMAGYGLNYKSTVDLEWNRTWPNPPTPAEIRTAMTDVRCNAQTNLANTYLTVEAAYERNALGQNQPALQQMEADFVTMQQRAEQVLQLPATDVLRFSKLQVHKAVPLLIPRVHGRPARDR